VYFLSCYVFNQSLQSEERHENLLKQKVLSAQRAPFFLAILTRKTRRCAPQDLGGKIRDLMTRR
jgi:hypothetical protein